MKKIELLAPAGNMEALKAAIQAGADAVYIGGKSFGARAFSKNFTNEEIIEAINYAHLYGVKLYVTVNTSPVVSNVSLIMYSVLFGSVLTSIESTTISITVTVDVVSFP